MSSSVIVFAIILLIGMVLWVLGYQTRREEIALGFVPNKEKYPFASFRNIGYGFVKLIPGIAEIKEIKLRQIIFAKAKNIESAKLEWKACIANAFVGFYTFLLIDAFSPIVLNTTDIKSSDANIIYILLSFVTGFMPFGLQKRVQDKENKRIEEILDELPNAINKMVIFLETGMPMTKVIEKISHTDIDNPLYEEFKLVKANTDNGMPIKQALLLMKERCKCPEIARFYVIIEQNISKGTTDCNLALTELGMDLWKSMNDRIRRKGADISQKLLLPTFMQLIATLMIAIVPAFFSLKSL